MLKNIAGWDSIKHIRDDIYVTENPICVFERPDGKHQTATVRAVHLPLTPTQRLAAHALEDIPSAYDMDARIDYAKRMYPYHYIIFLSKTLDPSHKEWELGYNVLVRFVAIPKDTSDRVLKTEHTLAAQHDIDAKLLTQVSILTRVRDLCRDFHYGRDEDCDGCRLARQIQNLIDSSAHSSYPLKKE